LRLTLIPAGTGSAAEKKATRRAVKAWAAVALLYCVTKIRED
jgi:hypothetical protein